MSELEGAVIEVSVHPACDTKLDQTGSFEYQPLQRLVLCVRIGEVTPCVSSEYCFKFAHCGRAIGLVSFSLCSGSSGPARHFIFGANMVSPIHLVLTGSVHFASTSGGSGSLHFRFTSTWRYNAFGQHSVNLVLEKSCTPSVQVFGVTRFLYKPRKTNSEIR